MMRTTLSRGFAAIAIAVSALLPAPATTFAASTAIKPSVEIDGNGYQASSAVDPSGAVHTVYQRFGLPGVWYATNRSGTFVRTRLTTAVASGRPVIGVDALGHVSVAFANQSASPGIRFLTDRSGTWQATRLTTGAFDLDPAIAVHASGEVHIAFSSASDIAYLTNRRGYWARLRLTTSAAHPAIALDSNRRVHVTYEKAGGIAYRTDATGAWVSGIVAPRGSAPAIAVVGTSPRIAYAIPNDGAAGGVFYATKSGTAWASAPVRSGYVAESHPAIALDAAGKAYLAYDGTGSGASVEYATDSTGSWVLASVGAGAFPSIGLGTAAARLITFAGSAVYLRSSAAPAWAGEVVSPSAYDPKPDLAMGADDVPRIVYGVPFTDPGLRFGAWTGTGFATSRITYAADTSPALAMDADGHAHVAFIRAGATAELWYGTDATGSWAFQKVDATDTLDCPAIAIGPTGAVHLAAFREHSENGFTFPRVAWYHQTGSSWSMLEDLPIDSFPGCPDLAVDAAGAPHLVYETGTRLTQATRSGSTWVSAPFGEPGDRLPRIAIGPDGTIVISFGRTNGYDVPDGGLYVRTNATGTYVSTQVGKTADIGVRHGLDVDADGAVHLAYRGYAWDVGLHVATNAGGTWQVVRLLDADTAGPVLAVTAAGDQHVATVGALTSGGTTGVIHLSD